MTTSIAPEAAVSTELAPVSAAKAVLAKSGVTLSDVLGAIAQTRLPAKVDEPVPAVAPEVSPKPIVLSEDLKVALERILVELEDVQGELPTKRTRLTADQRTKLGRAFKDARRIKLDMESLIKNTFRVAWFNHFDVVAEKGDDFDADNTPVDGNGFFIRPDSEAITGVGTVKREVGRATPSLDWDVLQEAVKAGELPKTAITAMTTSVRVGDDAKVVAFFSKNPQFAAVLARATKISPSASLNFR